MKAFVNNTHFVEVSKTLVTEWQGFFIGPITFLSGFLVSIFSLIVDLSNKGTASQLTVEMNSDRTLLQALHDAHLPVSKACRNGGCGICRCRLVAGEISYGQRQPFALWEKDQAEGFILPCIATPLSDLKIDLLRLAK